MDCNESKERQNLFKLNSINILKQFRGDWYFNVSLKDSRKQADFYVLKI